MDLEKISLTGAPETLLTTLYCRAVDSRAENPVLGDDAAARAVERVDYDFRRTGVNRVTAAGVALRAKQLDDWTAEFMAEHEKATVLHLACGLDTRAQRLAPASTVRWYDVDYPQVMELRQRLLTTPDGDYHTIASSVTEDDWLDSVPADRPTATVFEGLSMYLTEEDGKRLIQRIAERFPSGQLLFDCYGKMGIRMQKLVPAVRNSGATLHWAIEDPSVLESWHPGLRCRDAIRSLEIYRCDKFPREGRTSYRVLSRLPGFKNVGRFLRYEF
ncbi:class I SAM-dependent methyltransferase [Pseudonocardia eucalypti]|uniref:Class I SAM-dependent methyltransferase n=1 Tax=Pseudonocardia eucalypti TaxID=648755 RepID=A0ABP9PX47_9PSEU|nr:methyltransferase (TIGR00027 family) [Pseudonocardia eucalypti]